MAQKPIDIFLSKRQSVDPIAIAFVNKLEARGFNVCWQKNLRQYERDMDHRECAQNAIKRSRAFLSVICTDTWFDEVEGQAECYQETEIDTAISEHEHRANRITPYFTYVAFSNSGDVTGGVFEERMRGIGYGKFSRTERRGIRVDEHGGVDEQTIDQLVDQIADDLGGENLAEPKTTPHSTTATPTAHAANLSGPFNYVDYFNATAPQWRQGKSVTDEAPFDFSTQRYIPLHGHLKGDAVSQVQQIDSVEEALVEARDNILFLQADAGAGKSTTLSSIAITLGSLVEDAKSPFASQQLKQIREKLSDTALSTDFKPVYLDCEELAQHLMENEDGGDVSRFFARAAKAYPALAGWQRDAVVSKYLIILDGLDEVKNTRLRETLLNDAKEVWRYYGGRKSKIRLVVASRPFHVSSNEFDILELIGPDASQVDQFINSYVEERWHDDASRAHFEARIKNNLQNINSSEKRQDEWHEIRNRPLLLNAFCWFSCKRDDSVEADVGSFFERIIDYLLESTNTKDEALIEFHRELLQVLSEETIENNNITTDAAVMHVLGVAERHDKEFSSDDARDTLDQLQKETALLTHNPLTERWRIAPGFFRAYLAAERFALHTRAGGRHIHSTIIQFNRQSLMNWEHTLQFAFSLRQRGGIKKKRQANPELEWVYRIPSALVTRAEGSEAIDFKRPWLEAACQLFRYGVAPEAIKGDGLNHLEEITERVIKLYHQIAPDLTPEEKASLLNSVSNLAHRLDHILDLPAAANSILSGLLKSDTRWIDTNYPSACGGRIFLHYTPLLVADYRSFLETSDVDPSIWDHAPEQFVGQTIDKETDNSSKRDHKRPPAEIWSEISNQFFKPVTYVSWYEVVAYARWLTEQLRQRDEIGPNDFVRLLSENEWRDLARQVANGAIYPWGDDGAAGIDDSARVNYALAGIDGPSPPGAFAPYGLPGLYDFGSNVSSWALAQRGEPSVSWPPKADENDHVIEIGGSWNSSQPELSVNYELMEPPAFERTMCRGVRLALIKN